MSEPLKDKPKEEKGFSDRELMTYVVVFALTGFTLGVIGVLLIGLFLGPLLERLY